MRANAMIAIEISPKRSLVEVAAGVAGAQLDGLARLSRPRSQ
jgi:hypothetical protein